MMGTFKIHVIKKSGPAGICTFKVEYPTELDALNCIGRIYGEQAEKLDIYFVNDAGEKVYFQPIPVNNA